MYRRAKSAATQGNRGHLCVDTSARAPDWIFEMASNQIPNMGSGAFQNRNVLRLFCDHLGARPPVHPLSTKAELSVAAVNICVAFVDSSQCALIQACHPRASATIVES